MHRFQIKIRTIFLELLLVYPVINIMGCVFFHGDNMTTLSLSYCSILILLYVTDVKKLSRKNIYILIIFAFILILEIYRDQNMFILFVTFIFANIMLSIYSSNKIMVKEYIEYFVKKKNQFYIVQLVFLIILFLFVMKNGLTAGWNTWVLQGPYNYPHTLAYLFLFMMMLDTFYFIEFREKFVILFIAVSFACIILTAVRSVLIASIIVIGYIFYRVFSRKQFIKFILYCFLLFVCIYIAYNYGLFDALLTKSKLALVNGSISNGRSSILISSLYALKQGNEYVNTICGVGMTNLLKWNGININANIHAHNDFADALVGFGLIGLGIYVYNFVKFCKNSFIWMMGTVGFLAYVNGLFVYSDIIPILIYAKLLFSYSKIQKNRIGKNL